MDEKLAELIEKNKGILRQLTDLNKRVRTLEQKDTYFPIRENREHLIGLNNCVDDDEAILHKGEIF